MEDGDVLVEVVNLIRKRLVLNYLLLGGHLHVPDVMHSALSSTSVRFSSHGWKLSGTQHICVPFTLHQL